MQAIPAIRYCIPEDIPFILPLVKKSVTAVLPDEEYEEDRIKSLFTLALNNEEYTGICLTVDGRVEGYVLGFITEHYFHSKKIAYCMSIFVNEEFRKYGIEMINAFEAWGKYRGAKTLSISTFTNLSPKNLGRVYKRLGFEEKEVAYWKEV